MAHHLVRILCFAPLAAALILPACGKPPPATADGESSRRAAVRAAAADSSAARPDAMSGRTVSRTSAPGARAEELQGEDLPPWLAELLHSPDANVRIQALDAWAREPGTSLDPVTYALVDPDESVRARAQEVLEHELARR